MPNAFSIAGEILIAGFNVQGKDHNETLDKIFRVGRQENVKHNKLKLKILFLSYRPILTIVVVVLNNSKLKINNKKYVIMM